MAKLFGDCLGYFENTAFLLLSTVAIFWATFENNFNIWSHWTHSIKIEAFLVFLFFRDFNFENKTT